VQIKCVSRQENQIILGSLNFFLYQSRDSSTKHSVIPYIVHWVIDNNKHRDQIVVMTLFQEGEINFPLLNIYC
jgi:hypothetical protein